VQHPPLADPPGGDRPSRAKLFLFGVLGLLAAVVLATLAETLIAGEGQVSKGFFVAAAALTPVIGLGLLVQLVAALAGTTRGLLRELKRFNEEMASEPPELSEGSVQERRATWEGARDFLHVLAPFVAGLALQLVVTEAVAIYGIAAGLDERLVAIAVGIEIFALFNYLLFFNALLKRLAGGGKRAALA
jgi:ATP-dependent protease HslVU (ClpYQ) peptidase subunit